jgi:iron complex outermembrane receptor protein
LAVLEVTKTLNEHLSIVSVTGYEDQDYVNVQDTDGTRSGDPALPLGDIQKTHIPLRPQIQEDLRLVSEDNAFWDWQVGGYYHRETTETKVSAIQLANQAGNIAPVELDTIAALSAEEFAVYTHNTFKVTDQLNIIAGLRYQQVRYNSHQPTEAYVTTSTGQRLIDLVATGFIPGNGMPLDEAKQTYYPVTGTLKAQYFFSPDLMGYITGDYAYRTGALNLNIQGNLPPEFAMIDPESAASAEMGLKGTFGNQRGRFATALFYQLYDDFQQDIQNVWVFQTTGIPALRTANLLRNAVVNAGQSVTKGIEADVSWMLTDTWSASFAAAYTIAKYTDFKNNLCSPVPTPSAANPGPLSLTTPFVTCDLTGEPLPQAPRWSGVVQSNYSHPLNDEIDWYFNGLLNFTSTQVDKVTRKTLSGYSTMDLFTGLRQADKQGWDVNLWVKNVFDRRVITRIFNPNVADPRTGKTFDLVGTNLPRQVGITGTYRFE